MSILVKRVALMTIVDDFLTQLKQLSDAQQKQLLALAQSMANAQQLRGESGAHIIEAIGLFDEQSLDEIANAIEDDCERIDWRDWE
jgi:hypothetical protein